MKSPASAGFFLSSRQMPSRSEISQQRGDCYCISGVRNNNVFDTLNRLRHVNGAALPACSQRARRVVSRVVTFPVSAAFGPRGIRGPGKYGVRATVPSSARVLRGVT